MLLTLGVLLLAAQPQRRRIPLLLLAVS